MNLVVGGNTGTTGDAFAIASVAVLGGTTVLKLEAANSGTSTTGNALGTTLVMVPEGTTLLEFGATGGGPMSPSSSIEANLWNLSSSSVR